MTFELNNYQRIDFSEILRPPLENLCSSDFKMPIKPVNWFIFNHLTEVWKKSLKNTKNPNFVENENRPIAGKFNLWKKYESLERKCPNWLKIRLLSKKMQPRAFFMGHPVNDYRLNQTLDDHYIYFFHLISWELTWYLLYIHETICSQYRYES